MEELFKKSDKSLRFMQTLLLVLMWVGIVVFFILGIVCWSTSSAFNGELAAQLTAYGFECWFLGIPALVLGYYIDKFFLWLCFDLKVIRTAVAKTEYTPYLQEFSKKTESVKTEE